MENLFSRKFSHDVVRHGGRLFDMDQKIYVLLRTSTSCGSGVDSIAESIQLREGYANSHAISLVRTRERTLLCFHGACVVMATHLLTCNHDVASK